MALTICDGSIAVVFHSPRPDLLVGGALAQGCEAPTVISEAGVDPIVSALVYVAARAPDAGEDYAALAANFPPANAGLVKSGGFAQLSEEAFLKDFAGGGDQANRRPRGPAKRQE